MRAGGDVQEDVDYFDKTDLGGLRRRLRRAIEDKQREQKLYLEIVARYLQVDTPVQDDAGGNAVASCLRVPATQPRVSGAGG